MGQSAEVFIPSDLAKGESPSILIALHGHGESGKGLEVGARAWREDYKMGKMYQRLLAPPLTSDDVGGYIEAERLAAINASLAERPFGGLCIACPYTPDVGQIDSDLARDYATFLSSKLIPETAEAAGGKPSRDRTGIDGVSMGGRMALIVGLSRPDMFGAVCGMMPAIEPIEAKLFAELALRAHRDRPQQLRLVSTEQDPYLPGVKALSKELDRLEVPHRTVIAQGPHDYVWNRTAGACEMLFFHDRVLRGLQSV